MNSHIGVGERQKHPVINTILTSFYGETCFLRMSLVVESSPECLPHSLVNSFVLSLFEYLSLTL